MEPSPPEPSGSLTAKTIGQIATEILGMRVDRLRQFYVAEVMQQVLEEVACLRALDVGLLEPAVSPCLPEEDEG